jgi:hypothetical protein
MISCYIPCVIRDRASVNIFYYYGRKINIIISLAVPVFPQEYFLHGNLEGSQWQEHIIYYNLWSNCDPILLNIILSKFITAATVVMKKK